MNLEGWNRNGSSKNFGSFMKNERLAKNLEPLGNLNSPTAVGAVVV